MSRNSDRLGLTSQPETGETPPQMFNPLSFTAPTEFVTLPSKGIGYPKGHSLHGKDSIEIRYMTAKDEDVLSNQSLIKKGVALERLLENIIVEADIDPLSLLVVDRNAILIQARGTAYGFDYEARVKCPKCDTSNEMMFDLRNPKVEGGIKENQSIVTVSEEGLFSTQLPFSKFNIKFRLANGVEESKIAQILMDGREEFSLSEQYKEMILSIEGHSDKEIINQFVDNMPVADSVHFKMCLKHCTPSIDITEKLVCKNCSHEQEVQVPFGTDFFWPNT